MGVRASTYGFWRETIQCTKRPKLECWNICDDTVLSDLSRVVGIGKVNEVPENGGIVAMY